MTAEIRSRDDVVLRSAASADLPAVLGLLNRSHLPTAGVAEALSQFVVAEERGQLVGTVGLELYGDSALLRSAVVAEGWRGSGVGRALIHRALEIAERERVTDVFLLTTTAGDYFPRFGFDCVARDMVPAPVLASIEFREACPASATVMRKSLSA
jgi:amino-acid N-acetyltransferase